MQTQELKDSGRKALENVKRLAGEIRLEIHLAGMEAKDAWKTLEPKVANAEKMAEGALIELEKKVADLRLSLKKAAKR